MHAEAAEIRRVVCGRVSQTVMMKGAFSIPQRTVGARTQGRVWARTAAKTSVTGDAK